MAAKREKIDRGTTPARKRLSKQSLTRIERRTAKRDPESAPTRRQTRGWTT